jgi:hypothetical protein
MDTPTNISPGHTAFERIGKHCVSVKKTANWFAMPNSATLRRR